MDVPPETLPAVFLAWVHHDLYPICCIFLCAAGMSSADFLCSAKQKILYLARELWRCFCISGDRLVTLPKNKLNSDTFDGFNTLLPTLHRVEPGFLAFLQIDFDRFKELPVKVVVLSLEFVLQLLCFELDIRCWLGSSCR